MCVEINQNLAKPKQKKTATTLILTAKYNLDIYSLLCTSGNKSFDNFNLILTIPRLDFAWGS